MDNHFFVDEPNLHKRTEIEIKGQEARHASKVLRKQEEDRIFLANGKGCKAIAEIVHIQKNNIKLTISSLEEQIKPETSLVLAIGVIKNRDRFEFAIEKAVELGATTICLFNADHSERTRIKEERIEAIVQSAFKQAGRWWMPNLISKPDLKSVLFEFADHDMIMAHEKVDKQKPAFSDKREKLLLVGPEGGFSDKEVNLINQAGGSLISLGENRLRTETAVTALLSQFLYH